MTKKMLIWWVFFCLQVFGFFIAYKFDFYSLLLVADPTFISYGIILFHIFTFCFLGYYTYKNDITHNDTFWFISEAQLAFGMLGTLVGFVIMFSAVFAGTPTLELIKASIAIISVGVSTALWTTIVGLVSSIIIKATLVNLERKNSEQ
jgi:MotA/TolQ/ExbB proton channel family